MLYAVTDDKYASIILNSGEKVFVDLSLRDLEARLDAGEFFRPHQSYIVRLDAVRKVQKAGSLTLVLKDKTEIPVSRGNKDAVMKILGLI
ncbi:MAG: LytTR family transcriptional regulator DNA-binding domain-containing protein [Saprospirales bacterium]|nr:LytTR family transcriptional regulator DNA-binding domain-containing protein [Saprospirales bacterium]